MSATLQDLLIEQGATYSEVLTVYSSPGVLQSLTGYTAVMQIRQNIEDVAVLASSSIADPNIVLTLGGALGTITIEMIAEDTAALNFDTALYDIKITQTSTGDVLRVFEGEVKLSKSISRSGEGAPLPTDTFDHNDLSNIQGGSYIERYHLGATQHSTVGVGEINFTPKASAVGTAEGTMFYCSIDNSLYVGTE
jgi:hypothetical protein